MITATDGPLHHLALRAYLSLAIRRSFSAIYAHVPASSLELKQPFVLLPLHSSWWDGFFCYLLNRTYWHRRLRIMMLESELIRRPFFSKVGAFSIDPSTVSGTLTSLRYANSLCNQMNDVCLTIFPQGQIEPDFEAAISVKRGVSFIKPRSTSYYAPAYFHLAATTSRLPAIYLFVGELRQIAGDELEPDNILQTLLKHRQESLQSIVERRQLPDRLI